MSKIFEDVKIAILKARLDNKISKEKAEELEKKIDTLRDLEINQAEARAKKNPEYKGPSVKIVRWGGTRNPSYFTQRSTKKKNEPTEVKEEFGTSVAGAFGVTPNDVIGRPAPFKKESKNKQKSALLGYKYKKIRSNNINEEIDMKKLVEAYDVIIEAIEVLLEAEIPQFVLDAQEKRDRERREKEEAEKTRAEAARIFNFRQNVLRGKKTPGPMIK